MLDYEARKEDIRKEINKYRAILLDPNRSYDKMDMQVARDKIKKLNDELKKIDSEERAPYRIPVKLDRPRGNSSIAMNKQSIKDFSFREVPEDSSMVNVNGHQRSRVEL